MSKQKGRGSFKVKSQQTTEKNRRASHAQYHPSHRHPSPSKRAPSPFQPSAKTRPIGSSEAAKVSAAAWAAWENIVSLSYIFRSFYSRSDAILARSDFSLQVQPDSY